MGSELQRSFSAASAQFQRQLQRSFSDSSSDSFNNSFSDSFSDSFSSSFSAVSKILSFSFCHSNILDNYSCSSALKAVSGRVLDHSQQHCDLPDVFNNNCNRLHHLL